MIRLDIPCARRPDEIDDRKAAVTMANENSAAAATGQRPAYASFQNISIIVPIFNEKDSLLLLEERLFAVADGLGIPYEIIAVNDGSSDGSAEVLAAIAARRPRFKVVNFRRNFGQTAAMHGGHRPRRRATSSCPSTAICRTIPRTFRNLLAKLDEGYDVVSGWRTNRKDAAVRRNFRQPCRQPADLLDLRGAPARLRLHAEGLPPRCDRGRAGFTARCTASFRSTPVLEGRARSPRFPVNHHRPPVRSVRSTAWSASIKVVLDLMVVKFLDRYASQADLRVRRLRHPRHLAASFVPASMRLSQALARHVVRS